jgi:hypothetical protein
MRNAFFIILYSIIRGRLGVAKHLKGLPQKTRKTLPMQGTSMSVSCGIPKEPWKLGHLNKDSNGEITSFQPYTLRRLRKNVS